ncbi:MAG: hypothetical protein WBA25_02680 [Jannaschia sp.]
MGILTEFPSTAGIEGSPTSGGATVADLRALPSPQALTVLFLRDWCEGPEGRKRVASVLKGALGPAQGSAACEAWDSLIGMLVGEGRRPLMRHDLGCRCVGSDEAVIANLLAVAATGAREDAMLVVSLLLPGDRLIVAAHFAEVAGLAVARADLRGQKRYRPDTPNILH